jgi:hypothetical protein
MQRDGTPFETGKLIRCLTSLISLSENMFDESRCGYVPFLRHPKTSILQDKTEYLAARNTDNDSRFP